MTNHKLFVITMNLLIKITKFKANILAFIVGLLNQYKTDLNLVQLL